MEFTDSSPTLDVIKTVFLRRSWVKSLTYLLLSDTYEICSNFFLISEQMSCLLEEEADVVVQSLSHVRLFVTAWTIAHYTSLSFTTS